MEGEAKRDYPAAIFYQSPWWESYAKVEDYFARVNVLMSRGRAVRHLLVIHPIESMWVRFGAGWRDSPAVKRLDRRFSRLRDWLLQEHLDFDYGDEEMLTRLGRVRKTAGRSLLCVGKADYRAVLVPPLVTIRSATLALLERFVQAGGLVVFAGVAPAHVDARPSRQARWLASSCERVGFNRQAVCDAVAPACRAVSLRDSRGREVRSLLYQLREDAGALYLFINNLDRKRGCGPVEVRLPAAEGIAEEWDAESSKRFTARQRREGDRLVVTTDFPPTGSRLFVIRKKSGTVLPPRPQFETVSRQSLPRTPARVQFSEPNVLVLDRPAFRIEGGGWQGPEEVLRVDQAVRRALGVAPRGGMMVQPWARPPRKRQASRRVALRYELEVRALPRSSVALAVERPGRFAITVNGHRLHPDSDAGWWVDRSIRRLPVDPVCWRRGRSEIVLSTDYTEDDGLEAMFLLGDFGVEVDGTGVAMTAAVRKLRLGDWTPQGMPFYSGAVNYVWRRHLEPSPGEAVFLIVPRFKGACVRVLVNGNPAGIIAWPPHEVDIANWLVPGENELHVEVISSRRNAFGPLHQAQPENHWTGPGEFVTTGDRWMEGYNLKPHGLLAPPAVEFRRKI
jgi:hypothetical protein